jgi:hypothetical protein
MNHWRPSYRSKTVMWSLGGREKGTGDIYWEHYTPEDVSMPKFLFGL